MLENIFKSLMKDGDELAVSIKKINGEIELRSVLISSTVKPGIKETTIISPDKEINKQPTKAEIKAKVKELVSEGANYLADKQYQAAKKSYEKALILDPTNKYIQQDIATCDKWIKAIAAIGINPVVNNSQLDTSDLNFNIPVLNE